MQPTWLIYCNTLHTGLSDLTLAFLSSFQNINLTVFTSIETSFYLEYNDNPSLWTTPASATPSYSTPLSSQHSAMLSLSFSFAHIEHAQEVFTTCPTFSFIRTPHLLSSVSSPLSRRCYPRHLLWKTSKHLNSNQLGNLNISFSFSLQHLSLAALSPLPSAWLLYVSLTRI